MTHPDANIRINADKVPADLEWLPHPTRLALERAHAPDGKFYYRQWCVGGFYIYATDCVYMKIQLTVTERRLLNVTMSATPILDALVLAGCKVGRRLRYSAR